MFEFWKHDALIIMFVFRPLKVVQEIICFWRLPPKMVGTNLWYYIREVQELKQKLQSADYT